jgi:hypothetical protein
MPCLCRLGAASRSPPAPRSLVVRARASCNFRPCKPASSGHSRLALVPTCGTDAEGTRRSFASQAAQSSRRQDVTRDSNAIPSRPQKSHANLSQSDEWRNERSQNRYCRPRNGCRQSGSNHPRRNRRTSRHETNSRKSSRPKKHVTHRRRNRSTTHHRRRRNVVRKQPRRIRRLPPPIRWRAA